VTMGRTSVRDADTIAGMIGGLAGALCGASAHPPRMGRARRDGSEIIKSMAERFVTVIRHRRAEDSRSTSPSESCCARLSTPS